MTTLTTTTDYLALETHSAWLSTTASQIFYMQLGFLCFEIGFVAPEYVDTILIKNLEDVFSAIFGYAIFGWTLSGVVDSTNPIIGNFKYVCLINTSKNDFDTIFVNSCFAATAATIISGGVLERMRNPAYLIWVFLIISINYSFLAYWVWNENGWLYKWGFQDSAGCLAVHMLGGLASLIPLIYLGPRFQSISRDKKGKIKLKPIGSPNNVILMMIGTFILWYSWVGFNTVSPVSGNTGLGSELGATAYLTIVSPTASVGTVILLHIIKPSFKINAVNFMTAILSGLVAITASNNVVSFGSAIIIGFITPIFAFYSAHLFRNKLNIDDPLGVLPVHLISAILGLIFEGLLSQKNGLVYTGNPYHLGIQCLGIISCIIFCLITCLFYWEIILKRIIFRKIDIGITPLQLILKNGIKINDIEPWFMEILRPNSSFSRLMLQKFHLFLVKNVYCDEQLDFIIVVSKFINLIKKYKKNRKGSRSSVIRQSKSIPIDNVSELVNNVNNKDKLTSEGVINVFKRICEKYISEKADKQVNISRKTRTGLMDYQDVTKIFIMDTKEDDKEISVTGSSADIELDTLGTPSHGPTEPSPGPDDSKLDDEIYFINENIFNPAFLVVYNDLLDNFRLFLEKITGNYKKELSTNFSQNKRVKKLKEIYQISEKYDVEWVIDQKISKKYLLKRKKSIKATYASNKNAFIVNKKGEVKTVKNILNEIELQ